MQIRIRPVTRGRLGRLMLGVGAFELGHAAATLSILRATTVLSCTFSYEVAVRTAIGLCLGYNAIAAGLSFAGGRAADRWGGPAVLGLGVAAFLIAYFAFAFASGLGIVAAGFAVAGLGIGLVETAEHAAVAALAPEDVRGSALGLLAAVQGFGNLAASAIAGLLWTEASPTVAFTYLGAWMLLALAGLVGAGVSRTEAQ